jgi:ABC-type transport system substrate-binding protein
MRSTRRSEAYAGLVALGFLAAAALLLAVFLPDEPTAPRWRGAGSEAPRQGGTFVFHHESDVRGLDPHKSFDELSNMAIKLLFEGLLDYDRETLDLVPRLAEALPELSEDGLTYTFRLRRGVRFADSPAFPDGRGRELTAEDVRWSLERMLRPETASPGISFYTIVDGLEEFRAGRAEHVSGIRVADRYTISITIRQQDQTFIYAMAMPFAYPIPREAFEHYGAAMARNPVGTGPFVLESWEAGVQLVFARNPNFFIEGQPYVDRLVYTLNLDRRAAVMRFMNGDLDHIHRQTPADYLRLREMEAWAPYRVQEPKVNIWGLAMNCQLAPFDNRHVRRAVAFALNRERWRRARANRLIITGQPIPRSLAGFDESLEGQHRYDLARAREEMRLAGFPNGLPEPVEVWLGEGDTSRAYGELIQQDLRAIGIEVRLKQVAFPVFLHETGKPRTAQMVFTGWNMDFPDPSNFLDILFHSRSIHPQDSENKAFYSNPELDRILDEARVERDRERRIALYRQASRILVDDAPWAFTFSDLAMEMWQPYVRNYAPHPVWSNFYRDVWLDLPRERWAATDAPRPSLAAALLERLPPLARFGGGARR